MKENTILTTKELSKYLKLNEKTVIKMAQTGELPGFKVGNKWRFYTSTIDEYLQDKIVKSPKKNMSSVITSTEGLLPLSRMVDKHSVNLGLKSIESDGILYELSEMAQKCSIAVSTEDLFSQLKKREQMLSTAVGKGVAIPHPRNPSDELFRKSGIIIGRSKKGVDFHSPDKKKTHLFFLICATDVILHLNLLSKVATLFKTKDVFDKFMKAKTENDILNLLLQSETSNILP